MTQNFPVSIGAAAIILISLWFTNRINQPFLSGLNGLLLARVISHAIEGEFYFEGFSIRCLNAMFGGGQAAKAGEAGCFGYQLYIGLDHAFDLMMVTTVILGGLIIFLSNKRVYADGPKTFVTPSRPMDFAIGNFTVGLGIMHFINKIVVLGAL